MPEEADWRNSEAERTAFEQDALRRGLYNKEKQVKVTDLANKIQELCEQHGLVNDATDEQLLEFLEEMLALAYERLGLTPPAHKYKKGN